MESKARSRAFSPSMSPLNNLSQLHLEPSDASASVPAGVPVSTLVPASAPAKSSGFVTAKVEQLEDDDTTPDEDLMEDVTTHSSTDEAASGISVSGSGSVSSPQRSSATRTSESTAARQQHHPTSVGQGHHGPPPQAPSPASGSGSSPLGDVLEEQDAQIDDEDEEEFRRTGERYGMSSGGEVFAELDMDE